MLRHHFESSLMTKKSALLYIINIITEKEELFQTEVREPTPQPS